jgi:NitT/TauT family transport system substrate-binding protein
MLKKSDARKIPGAAIAVLTLAILAAFIAACAPGPAAQSTPQVAAPAKVRVGYLTSDLHHISHFVAQDPTVGGGQSLYQKFGLTIEDAVGAPYADGGTEMDRFAAGDVDIGLLGLPPAIIKHLNAGTATTVIAQVNEIGSSLVVGKGVNRFSDLVGKTVATPGHSSIQFFLLLTLAEKEGVDPGQMTIIDMPVKDMQARLEKGDIAGFVAWEPFPSEAVHDGAGKVLATSQDIWPNHPDCVVVASRKFLQEHPDTVQNFLQAHVAAVQWINGAKAAPDSKEYGLLVDLGARFTGRDAAVVKDAYNGIHYRATTDLAFRDAFMQFTDKLIQYKIVPAEKLQERGYKSVADFAASYIQPSPQEASK